MALICVPLASEIRMEKSSIALLEKLSEMSQLGFFASLGAIASYLRHSVINPEGKKFRWIIFLSNIIVAFITGNLVGDFVGDHEYRDGILIACGYACFPILDVIEVKARDLVSKFSS